MGCKNEKRDSCGRSILLILCCLLYGPGPLVGQSTYFAGALGGIATLSADGRSVTTPSSTDVSVYKPENGPAIQVVGGKHFSDYLSFQANYGWNRNSLALTSSQTSSGSFVFYEQTRKAAQHSVVGELMLYFRDRDSFARPYLSVGGGVIRLAGSEQNIEQTLGAAPAPGGFVSTKPALRVAVGIDLLVRNGWAFRFTFAETIRNNAVSALLTPPGRRNLANFQNLFGLVKHF